MSLTIFYLPNLLLLKIKYSKCSTLSVPYICIPGCFLRAVPSQWNSWMEESIHYLSYVWPEMPQYPPSTKGLITIRKNTLRNTTLLGSFFTFIFQ